MNIYLAQLFIFVIAAVGFVFALKEDRKPDIGLYGLLILVDCFLLFGLIK